MSKSKSGSDEYTEYTLGDLISGWGCDEVKLLEIMRHYQHRIIKWCLSLGITDIRDAEEIADDVFFELWRVVSPKMTMEQKEISVGRFINARLRWRRTDRLRQSRKLPLGLIMQQVMRMEQDGVPPDELVVLEELKKRFEYCIEQLPPRQKEIFQSFREEDLKQARVARRLNISQGTVSKRIWKQAMPKLEECLKEGGFFGVGLLKRPSLYYQLREFTGGIRLNVLWV